MVVTLLGSVTKINGLVPDKSLVAIDQRCLNVEQPITFKVDCVANLDNALDID